MWLENDQNRPEYGQNRPKNVENQANWTKNIQKVNKLLQKFYSQQKAWVLPSKSYCWSSNLLGTSCLGAATICSSVPSDLTSFMLSQDSQLLWDISYQTGNHAVLHIKDILTIKQGIPAFLNLQFLKVMHRFSYTFYNKPGSRSFCQAQPKPASQSPAWGWDSLIIIGIRNHPPATHPPRLVVLLII